MNRLIGAALLALALCPTQLTAAGRNVHPTRHNLVWGSVDIRYARTGKPDAVNTLSLHAWKGERVFAQAVFTPRTEAGTDRWNTSVEVSDLRCGKHVIPSSAISKAFVGYVLTDGYNGSGIKEQSVADRLDRCSEIEVKAGENQPLWFDIKVPQDAVPGRYKGTVSVTAGTESVSLPYTLTVSARTLPEPSQWAFHLDLWQNPYSVAGYFGVPLWSEEHFRLMRPVMERYAKAGGKVITASIIRHPWNGQTHDPFESMIVKMKRIDGSWQYDYEVFDRWVEFMMSCGVTEQIDCYTIVPWGYTFEYLDMATSTMKTFSCQPQDKEYEQYMLPFLTDFAEHLKEKGWFDRTCIAMDERPMDQLRIAREVLHEADPGFRIEGATDYSPEVVDIMYDISVAYKFDRLPEEVVAQRNRDGMHTTFYTCCGPERPNTFTFSPTAESAFIPLHAAALGYTGYLRWALNSWTTSPCTDSRHDIRDWHGGDCYLVYPEGSSMRFDRLVQGIQDFEKIRILREGASEDVLQRINAILEPFKPTYFDTLDAAAIVRSAEEALRKLE